MPAKRKEVEYARLNDASTGEALSMILGDDDEEIGRMSVGPDMSDFDLMPRNRLDDMPNSAEGRAGDELDLMADENAPTEIPHPAVFAGEAGDDEAVPFESPAETQFPIFKAALRRFQAAVAKPRVVRIDTEGTYGDYVSEKAVEEIARKVEALEAAIAEHDDNPYAHRAAFAEHNADSSAHRMSRQEVLGAAETISNLSGAQTPREAAAAMPQVPLNLPKFAEGKVNCWRDGNCIVCSIHFSAADGTHRIATMADRPKANVDELVGRAFESGVSPVTMLRALPDLADVACGERLLRDVAGAALKAQRRVDVCGMDDEPVILASSGDEVAAPLAALMFTEQRAEAGDLQARAEMQKIETAARTPSGRKIAMPLLAEARRRLAGGQEQKAAKRYGFLERYAQMAMVL